MAFVSPWLSPEEPTEQKHEMHSMDALVFLVSFFTHPVRPRLLFLAPTLGLQIDRAAD